MPVTPAAIYPSGDYDFARFASRRSTVHSTKGIVASSQPLACEAGHRILKQGGNAAVSRFAILQRYSEHKGLITAF